MANEFLAISDGTFILSETENKNQFYFYRKDEKVLADIDEKKLMELYRAYLMHKFETGEITDMVVNNIYSQKSKDEKCIRLTICDIGEKFDENTNSIVKNKQPNFLKRLLYKIFG